MYSPFAKAPLKQRGVAIIMAMLTVALVAGIAATILADYAHAIDQLSGRHDQAQARWLSRGAIDWARNVLESDYLRGGANRIDHLQEEWAIKVPPTPFEEGEISGELEELSGKFNLNSLVGLDGKPDKEQVKRFVRLLGNVGIAQMKAQQLANALVDWIDADDDIIDRTGNSETAEYRQIDGAVLPPQSYLLDTKELLSVKGFTPQIVQTLQPFVSAVPAAANQINVNTAPAEVLSAYITGLTVAQAQSMIYDRDRSFFTSTANFGERLPSTLVVAGAPLSVTSMYFIATGRARWGEAVTRMQVLLERKQARPDILWMKIL